MDVEVGSNLYQNTDGTIEIEGVPQIQVAVRPSTHALLVNFALFDAGGKLLAKMVDSTIAFNERRAYEASKSPKSVVLKNVASGKVVLQVELKAADVIAVTRGEFHTVKGHVIEVSPTEWKIEKQRTSGTTQDVNGGAVILG